MTHDTPTHPSRLERARDRMHEMDGAAGQFWHVLYRRPIRVPWGYEGHQHPWDRLVDEADDQQSSSAPSAMSALQRALWQTMHAGSQVLFHTFYASLGLIIAPLALALVLIFLAAFCVFYLPMLMFHHIVDALATGLQRWGPQAIRSRERARLPRLVAFILGCLAVLMLSVAITLLVACLPLLLLAFAVFFPAQAVMQGTGLHDALGSNGARLVCLLLLMLISPLLWLGFAVTALTRYILMPLCRLCLYALTAILLLGDHAIRTLLTTCHRHPYEILGRSMLGGFGLLLLGAALQPWLAHMVVMPAWLPSIHVHVMAGLQPWITGCVLAFGVACLWGVCHQRRSTDPAIKVAHTRGRAAVLSLQGCVVLAGTGMWVALQQTQLLRMVLPHTSASLQMGLALGLVSLVMWSAHTVCQSLLARSHQMRVSHVLEPYRMLSGAQLPQACLMGALVSEPHQLAVEDDSPSMYA